MYVCFRSKCANYCLGKKLFPICINSLFLTQISSPLRLNDLRAMKQKQQLTSDEAFISLKVYCSPWH